MIRLVVAAGVALSLAPVARAHEVVHEVRREAAVAVRIAYADGEPLAYAAYELWSPADPAVPHAKGRTDRNGWLAFVPDAGGAWRLKVVDGGGHGIDARVDVGEASAPLAARPAAAGARLARTAAGAALVAATFGLLFLWRKRRKGTS